MIDICFVKGFMLEAQTRATAPIMRCSYMADIGHAAADVKASI